MAGTRKLGKPTDQRLAMLKCQTTDVILNGKIVTTEARAKEVKALVDSIIALAVKEHKNFEEVEVKVVKAKLDNNGRKVTEKVTSKNGKEYLRVVKEEKTERDIIIIVTVIDIDTKAKEANKTNNKQPQQPQQGVSLLGFGSKNKK